jgi:hypothetical protein
VNLDVTISAGGVLRVLVVRWTSGLVGAHTVIDAMARQAQVIDRTELQHSRVCRSVRRVTRDTSVGLHRSVFESKWTLLIGVALEAGGVSTNRQPCLFQLETAMRIVAVGTFHGPFEDLVMLRHGELVFDFTVTTQAQLRLTVVQ